MSNDTLLLGCQFLPTFADINECEGIHGCHGNSNCRNTPGSYQCHCLVGFTGNGINCSNVNECSNSDSCDENANCTDTVGSFLCQCLGGYTGNGKQCNDINECSLGSYNCQPELQCKNFPGSYGCQCLPGFALKNGDKCENVNECLTNVHNCSENAVCTDTPGHFTCTCRSLYTGTGYHCELIGKPLMSTRLHFAWYCLENVDECLTKTHNCSENAFCLDSAGQICQFTCPCTAWYTGSGQYC